MTAKLSSLDLANLYERDIVLWSEQTIALLRQERFDELGLENLIDEVGDLGKRERDRLTSSIRLIMHHLLKWEYQPEKRSRSWVKTIQRERVNIQNYLEETPSLVRIINDAGIEKTYKTAREYAAIETDLPLKTLPQNCPYQWREILDNRFPSNLNNPQKQHFPSAILFHCKDITLTKKDSHEGEITAEHGVIQRLDNGKLQVRIETNHQDAISFSSKNKIGSPVDEDDYYKFTAVGENNKVWVADKVLWSNGDPEHTFYVCSNCIQIGTISEQANSEFSDTENIIDLIINEDLHLPRPWKDLMKGGSSVDYTFLNRNQISLSKTCPSGSSESFCIQYRFSTSESPVSIANSLCESMQFILAQKVSWSYLERRIGDRTDTWIPPQSSKTSYNIGRAKAPIRLVRVCSDNEQKSLCKSPGKVSCSTSQFWLLYEKYFSFILKDRNELEIHYLSGWSNRILEIDHQKTLESEMLTISVAVESILNKYFVSPPQKNRKGSEEDKEFQGKVETLRFWIGDQYKKKDPFRKRIEGFLKSFKDEPSRPIDILWELVQAKILDESLLRSWKEVRNKRYSQIWCTRQN